jgi:hypothetical protein
MRLVIERLAVGLLLLLSATAANGEIIDRVVAILPGAVVTQVDVQAALDLGLVQVQPGGDGFASALAALIDRLLMLNEVRRVMPSDPPPSAVQARIAQMRARFGTPAAFARALAASGIDDPILEVHAADDLRLSQYLEERFGVAAQPTPQEVQQLDGPARAQLAAERRQTLIAAWVGELRRRADVTVLSSQQPPAPSLQP